MSLIKITLNKYAIANDRATQNIYVHKLREIRAQYQLAHWQRSDESFRCKKNWYLFTSSLVVQRLFQFYCSTIRTWNTGTQSQPLHSNSVYVIKLQFSVSHGHTLATNWRKWRWTFLPPHKSKIVHGRVNTEVNIGMVGLLCNAFGHSILLCARGSTRSETRQCLMSTCIFEVLSNISHSRWTMTYEVRAVEQSYPCDIQPNVN